MPIDYEMEIVDAPLQIYGEYYENPAGFKVVIKPESEIPLFNQSLCSVTQKAILVELKEADETFHQTVTHEESPHRVIITGEVPDRVSLVIIGENIASGIKRAEDVLEESNNVDNAELNTGLASRLDR